MTQAQEQLLQEAVRILPDWFAAVARPLPWREDRDPYRVWISEIMLQQTRISAVLEYYARFMAALPDLAALAAVSEDELLKLWQGLGYYSRARNLRKTAQVLMERHGGGFPADYAEIRALPGIGDYTAGAIASISFGIPVPAVDGNVLRVLSRLLGDDSDISKEKTKKDARAALLRHMPAERSGDLNQGIMELGETICLPNGAPLCGECPLRELCVARREERTDELPVKAAAKERRREERNVWLLFSGDRVLLHRRGEKGLLAGLWEYPNFSPEERAGEEQLGLTAAGEPAGTGKHIFSHLEWHMKAYSKAYPRERELPEDYVWASGEELEQVYALPNAFRFADTIVRSRLSGGTEKE